MEALMHLLLPALWLFMLLEWIYKKLRAFVYRTSGGRESQRNHNGNGPGNRPRTAEELRNIEPPERNQQNDEGMEAQERTLPYITLPEPVKEEPIEIIYELPKRNGRELQDRGRG